MRGSKISAVLMMLGVALTLSACSSNKGAATSSSSQSQAVTSKQQAKKQTKININDLANSVTAYPQTDGDGFVVSYVVVPDETTMVKINKSLPETARMTRLDFAQAFQDGGKSHKVEFNSPSEVNLAQVARSLNLYLDTDLTEKYRFVGSGIKSYTPIKSEDKHKDVREVVK